MSEKQLDFGKIGTNFTDDFIRLLICIAVSNRGLTEEEWAFIKKAEKEFF